MNKWIIISLCVLIAAYIFFPNFFPGKEYKPDQALIDRIDSLEKVNIALQQQITKYDSINAALESRVHDVDNKIGNIKEKTTIIKEYYRDKKQETSKYTPTQLDSFFRDRYNY
jgi:predicted RNase H-like nuclease (RuvC/YqgF family)